MTADVIAFPRSPAQRTETTAEHYQHQFGRDSSLYEQMIVEEFPRIKKMYPEMSDFEVHERTQEIIRKRLGHQ